MSKEKIDEKNQELIFNIGEVINGYKLVEKIDEGGFGQVFKVTKDEKNFYAMKLESNSQEGGSAIKLEINVLRQLPNNSVFPEMKCGGKRLKFHYLVLELLGDNLKVLKSKSTNPDAFTDGTWSRLGIQCLYALKTMHDRGFVHRDVKPSNFALSLSTPSESRRRRVMLFDFGLARKFVKTDIINEKPKVSRPNSGKQKTAIDQRAKNSKSNSRPQLLVGPKSGPKSGASVRQETIVHTFRIARPHTDFRGTMHYASPNAHSQIELGRHDDLWSLMYMVAEMFLELPWTNNDDIPVEDLKNQSSLLRLFTDDKNPAHFSADQDQRLKEIDQMLKSCNYYDHPNYELIYQFFKEAMSRGRVTWESPFDWDVPPKPTMESSGPVPSPVAPAPVTRTTGTRGSAKLKNGRRIPGVWECPGDFFKIDRWSKLKKPTLPEKSSGGVEKTQNSRIVDPNRRTNRSKGQQLSREDSVNVESLKKEVDSKKGSEKQSQMRTVN